MPELPEIETVKRTLEPKLCGRRILSLDVRRPEVLKHPEAEAFALVLPGQQVANLSRRGKYLCIHMEQGDCIVVHLRMTGRLLCQSPDQEEQPHTHVVFRLDDGQELRFSDVRRFGGLWLLLPGEEDRFTGLSKLGPEPLEPGFTPDYLMAKLEKRKATVKQAILDQTVVAGLGNIYADESLYVARIRPDRPCCTLTPEEWQTLVAAIRQVLTEAIQRRGTTFSDFLDGDGHAGENYPFLLAYQRGGQPCRCCGTEMEKTRIGGRGTCFCPVCQK